MEWNLGQGKEGRPPPWVGEEDLTLQASVATEANVVYLASDRPTELTYSSEHPLSRLLRVGAGSAPLAGLQLNFTTSTLNGAHCNH